MNRVVQLLPEMEQESYEAFRWYERQRPGLGFDFILALDAALERVRRLPEGHEIVALRTRKALLRRFPYLVLYALEEKRILVTAVFHGRRDPRRWSDRVRESEPAPESLKAPAASGEGTQSRMSIEFTAVFRRVPEGYMGFVEEIPGANTQGGTLEEARRHLREAAVLVLEANRTLAEEQIRGQDVIREPLQLPAA